MTISELCIRRPVMTVLSITALLVFGVISFFKLPISALPKVDFPTINVSASLPGASPEVMSSSVAAILERQFSTISGVSSMSSISGQGSTSITLQFDLDRDIDGAALDVQTAISASLRRLPTDLSSPPSFRKVNPSDQPILFIALTGENLKLSQITEIAETVVQQRISQISGVAQVQIFGAQKFAIRIAAKPDVVASRGISFDSIRDAVSAANSNQATGVIKGDKQKTAITSNNQMIRPEDYSSLLIRSPDNSDVRLADIATIYESVENDQAASWLNRDRSVLLAVYRQSDANTVAVVDSIQGQLASYRDQLPNSIALQALSDRSVPIRNSILELEKTLMISVLLVIVVIFLFLRSFRATLIPALAIPISLIGTFAVMALLGYSLNIVSMLALTLAVGFVVDDAIVMLENITRTQEMGIGRIEAALRGSSEIGFTIISITFSLIAVFIPVFFMGGVVGRIFTEFAAVMSIAILISGFVSLTLTPMLCSRILVGQTERLFRSADYSEKKSGRLHKLGEAAYRKSLDFSLDHKFFVLILTISSIGLSVKMYTDIPKGFFPQEDTGLIRVSTEGPLDMSFEAMSIRQRSINEIILADPAVAYLTSSVGFGSSNQGFGFVQLKPRNERDDVLSVISRLRKATSGVVGISSIFQSIQNVSLSGGRSSRSQYQYSIQGADLSKLYDTASKIFDEMTKLKELRDVNSDAQVTNPMIMVDVNREKAAFYGIDNSQVRRTLFNLFGSQQISTIYTGSNDYAVILESDRAFQSDPNAIRSLTIRNSDGKNVPIESFATISKTVGPLTVSRQFQQPAVTLSFNLAPGIALGTAVEAIRAIEREVGLGAQFNSSFSGAAQLFQDSLKGQGVLILMALLVIYFILGALYESFVHPITILSGLPSAGIGALLSLNLMGLELSVIAVIGILLLLGLVKKNAIMMIDFAIERRKHGLDATSAIREAALIRFRPIMMTTIAALLGAVPIAFGSGAGAEFMKPLGVTIVGGLLVSQILTLYITPVIYIYLDRIDGLIRDKEPSR